MNHRREAIGVEFMDAIFGLAAGLAVILVLLAILVKEEGKPSPEREGKYIITVTWNSGVDSDLDLWARAPDGTSSGFLSRDRGGLSLLRDDLGNTNDRVGDDKGNVVLNPMNREEITVRSTVPGDYVVNVHLFRVGNDQPPEGLTVKVELRTAKENTVVVENEFKVEKQGDEKTAFVFTLDKDGAVSKTEKPEPSILWVVNRGGGYTGP